MKKICFVTTISSTLKSFVIPQAEALHRAHPDWEIVFICNDDKEFEKALPEYIRFIPVQMNRGIDFKLIKSIRAIEKVFKDEQFDMVQYSTPNAAFYASIAAKKAKIPVRIYCQWGMVFVSKTGLKRAIFKKLEKIICKNSTSIQPDSYGNLNYCRSQKLYGEEKSCVIWNGSATGVCLDKYSLDRKSEYNQEIRQKYGIDADDKVIGFVGRLGREKGCNELFEAFRRVKEKIPTAKLLFVGPMEKKETIDPDILKYFESCNDIIKVGQVDNVEKYLSAMDLFVLPSYREGFGMSVVEAEAMAVPAVVTEYPGPDGAIKDGETGITVKLRDVNTLYDAMIKLLNDPDLAKAYGANGRKYIEDSYEQTTFMRHYVQNRETLLNCER